MRSPLVVNWGAGVNSTALVVGLLERDERPDLVIFADTGGEKPHTYRFVGEFRAWLVARGLELVTVQNEGIDRTLEASVLRRSTLPSLAFGWKSCSQRFKREPVEKYENNWAPTRDARRAGVKITKAIGFDADERRRATKVEDERNVYRYPLIEWKWGRDECEQAIARAGLSDPGKSACFFCPASKAHEILELRRRYPDLAARALAIEDRARPNLVTVKGLGRRFAWRDLLAGQPCEDSGAETPCECMDESEGER